MSEKNNSLKICELLDVCRECEFYSTLYKRNSSSEVCNKCDVYHDLCNLGNQIWGPRKTNKFSLEIEKYKNLRDQGLTDVAVAEKLKTSVSTLVSWKQRKKQELTNLGLYRKSKAKS
ncbi:hypothetical protein V7014_25065 [Bacillus sp. JJ722]